MKFYHWNVRFRLPPKADIQDTFKLHLKVANAT